MVGILVGVCRCATSWCDLDLTFDIAVVTLTIIILSGIYLGIYKVRRLIFGMDISQGFSSGGIVYRNQNRLLLPKQAFKQTKSGISYACYWQ